MSNQKSTEHFHCVYQKYKTDYLLEFSLGKKLCSFENEVEKLTRQKILQKHFCSIFSHFTSVKQNDIKTFLLEIYKASIEKNLSFNQSFSTIAKISRLKLFRLNVIGKFI